MPLTSNEITGWEANMSLNAKEYMWVRKQVMREDQQTASQSELIEALGWNVDKQQELEEALTALEIANRTG